MTDAARRAGNRAAPKVAIQEKIPLSNAPESEMKRQIQKFQQRCSGGKTANPAGKRKEKRFEKQDQKKLSPRKTSHAQHRKMPALFVHFHVQNRKHDEKSDQQTYASCGENLHPGVARTRAVMQGAADVFP